MRKSDPIKPRWLLRLRARLGSQIKVLVFAFFVIMRLHLCAPTCRAHGVDTVDQQHMWNGEGGQRDEQALQQAIACMVGVNDNGTYGNNGNAECRKAKPKDACEMPCSGAGRVPDV